MAGQPQQAASPSAWLKALRAEAVERVGVLKLPTTRDEEWRFTDISLLSKTSFASALSATCLEAADVAHFFIEEANTRLVFVDGIYAPQLSSASTDSSVVVSNLTAAMATHAAVIKPHLGQHAPFSKDAFAAQNTAFLHDAAVVIVPRDVSVAAPVHLLFIATQKDVVSTPRCLVLAEAGSAVTVIEDYVVLYQPRWQEDAHFTNAVTEVVLKDNAHVTHIRVQREGSQAFHIANCSVSLGRASNYQSVSVALGARISRYNLNVLQTAEGATCALDGLTLISGRQLADTHSCMDHAHAHGSSRQLHKCIIGGSAHAVFNGKVMVREGAQRTDAQQSNRNLLLTAKAHIDTKPQLEIFASDVKCTHGATVGQLDSEEVFYLQSRGLTEVAARNLLTYAFGAEIIDRIPIASLKRQLEQAVLEQTGSMP
ncbi:Fe-S cluster assembly protein SufD [Pseudomonas sp. MH9.2]|uniref:Fe-S cluster assembly protein SufD n=1 Tax=Pseudomonas sp. MH9.2 TaxID=3048629 RepID=UPI002AC99E02|nr:Fe-S cluster assembly protein SufD [Pseudomonas sp. MH9.2]MEB0027366.1 Fe-S cluster assembly protein SufD [Pseudomonas sp. MH9.2]WPX68827.1 Fe-S cluster assembly protein SufD [Pseudomonas sp. MH9.2]